MEIRSERAEDVDTIRALTQAAFEKMPFSDQTEARIIDALRAAGALPLSLVAIERQEILGHVAFSPVTINGALNDWYGLGPVSVWPERQKSGIGQALIRDGLHRLTTLGANGCVLLGSPDYYSRFGFIADPRLTYGDAPAKYFQRLVLKGLPPSGEVKFHPAFEATG